MDVGCLWFGLVWFGWMDGRLLLCWTGITMMACGRAGVSGQENGRRERIYRGVGGGGEVDVWRREGGDKSKSRC